jgi:hypothetical protein
MSEEPMLTQETRSVTSFERACMLVRSLGWEKQAYQGVLAAVRHHRAGLQQIANNETETYQRRRLAMRLLRLGDHHGQPSHPASE